MVTILLHIFFTNSIQSFKRDVKMYENKNKQNIKQPKAVLYFVYHTS